MGREGRSGKATPTLPAPPPSRSALGITRRLWKTPSSSRVTRALPSDPPPPRGPAPFAPAPDTPEGPVARDGALGEERDQAAELPVLDADAEEEEDDDAAEAAGFASDDEPDGAGADVEDFAADDAGELLDDEPRLSFR